MIKLCPKKKGKKSIQFFLVLIAVNKMFIQQTLKVYNMLLAPVVPQAFRI